MLPEAGTLILQGQKSDRANVGFRSPLTDLVAYRRGNERTGKELFEEKGRTVFMPASIWTELALLGRWVQDSVVIRWAGAHGELLFDAFKDALEFTAVNRGVERW